MNKGTMWASWGPWITWSQTHWTNWLRTALPHQAHLPIPTGPIQVTNDLTIFLWLGLGAAVTGRMILSLKGSGWMPCHFWSSLAFWFDGRGSDWEQQQSTVLKTAWPLGMFLGLLYGVTQLWESRWLWMNDCECPDESRRFSAVSQQTGIPAWLHHRLASWPLAHHLSDFHISSENADNNIKCF